MQSRNRLDINLQKNIESIIQYHMQQIGTPGCSVAVIKDAEVVYVKGFGNCKINSSEMVNEKTQFSIGSITKSFTCLGIMLLDKENKLSIEDSISKFLPIDLGGKENEIQIKHLMNHSSGLPNIFLATIIETQLGLRTDYFPLRTQLNNIPMKNWDNLFKYLSTNKDFITTKPGNRFHYSDTSFSLLYAIIEKVSGLSYSEYIKQQLFDPLEMIRSQFRSKYDPKTQNIATGHIINEINNQKKIDPVMPNYPESELLDGGGYALGKV